MPNEGRFKKPEEYAPVQEPAKLPVTSEGWREIREELNAAIAAEEEELEKIAAQIEEHSLHAVVGDIQAQRTVSDLRRQQLERELNVRLKKDALKPAEHALKVAMAREAEAVENRRQAEIQALKQEMMSAAVEFDRAAIALREALSRYHSAGDKAHNLMSPSERENFHAARGSIGPSNALGFHKVARPLGLTGISGNPMHHQPLADFARVFCEAPRPVAPATEPLHETVVYTTEVEALSQVRPR
jgi:hypothetical protein